MTAAAFLQQSAIINWEEHNVIIWLQGKPTGEVLELILVLTLEFHKADNCGINTTKRCGNISEIMPTLKQLAKEINTAIIQPSTLAF